MGARSRRTPSAIVGRPDPRAAGHDSVEEQQDSPEQEEREGQRERRAREEAVRVPGSVPVDGHRRGELVGKQHQRHRGWDEHQIGADSP